MVEGWIRRVLNDQEANAFHNYHYLSVSRDAKVLVLVVFTCRDALDLV